MDLVFKALADPTRRSMLDILATGSNTMFELRTRLIMEYEVDMSRQAIAKHLSILEQAGLVRTRKAGRYKMLQLDPRPINEIADRWVNKYKSKE